MVAKKIKAMKDNKSPGVEYRPVSLTSVICKLLEKLIKDDTLDFLVKC